MRSSPAARRLRARPLTLASMTAIAALASAGAASASGVVFVDELASTAPHSTTAQRQADHGSVTLAGSLTNDLHLTNQSVTGTYTGTAGPGHMAVGVHLADQPADLDFANVHVVTQYTDAFDVSGLAAGRSVTVHQILRISGSSAISEPGPPGTRATARTDLTIDGTGVPEGPFFGAFGGPTYATSRHSRPSSHITDRDLGPPDAIDLIFSLTAGQGGGFFLNVDLNTELITGSGGGDILAGYDITWGHGGFLTLNDADGVDTGVRAGPGVTVHSASGFNVLTGRDGAAGSAPEPASWALMILGFAGAGAALRRRGPAAA